MVFVYPFLEKEVVCLTVVTLEENSIEVKGHAPEAVVCHGILNNTPFLAGHSRKLNNYC